MFVHLHACTHSVCTHVCVFIYNSVIFFCFAGLPSVSKVELNLQAEFSVEYIFHELLSSVPTISNSVTLRLFKVLHYSDPHQAPMSIHYSPCRPQQMVSFIKCSYVERAQFLSFSFCVFFITYCICTFKKYFVLVFPLTAIVHLIVDLVFHS